MADTITALVTNVTGKETGSVDSNSHSNGNLDTAQSPVFPPSS